MTGWQLCHLLAVWVYLGSVPCCTQPYPSPRINSRFLTTTWRQSNLTMTKFDSGALSKHATLQKRRRCAITSLPSLTCLVISEDSSEMITLKKPTLMSAMKKGHGGLKYKSKRYSSLVGLDSGNVSDTSSASSTTSDQSSQSWPPLPESISVKRQQQERETWGFFSDFSFDN